MQKKPNATASAGFTLIEILIIITITTLLITAAIPGWNNFMQNNQAMAISGKLSNALNLARATAIQSGKTVILCPITAPTASQTTSCQPTTTTGTCLTTYSWDSWVAFIGVNTTSTTWTVNQGELYYCDIKPGSITASNTSLAFTAAGFTTATAITTFTIKPPGCTGNNGRIVTVMPSGNIKTEFTTCP